MQNLQDIEKLKHSASAASWCGAGDMKDIHLA
jgi:hypothetical protein